MKRPSLSVRFAGVLLSLVAGVHLQFAHAQGTKSSPSPGRRSTIGSITYTNREYGFRFALPSTWKGYSVVAGSWTGRAIDEPAAPAEHGPEISIRNPRWTQTTPYQDIPILVFTHEQWTLVSQEKIAVSAAPFGPTELGRNARYVFALPPRYNYAFPQGYEEVEKIIASHPFHPF